MSKKMKLTIILSITMLLLVTSISGITYSWLSDRSSNDEIINITLNNAKLDGNVSFVTTSGGDDVYLMDSVVSINDLAYIDIENDFVSDQYHTLNNMASVITMTINSTSNVNTHAWIGLPNIVISNNNYQGFIYLIVLPTDLENGRTYASIANDIVTANGLVNSNKTNIVNNHDTILKAIDTYNQNKLAEIYENNPLAPSTNNTPTTLTFDIVLWGDYYGLSASDQALNVHLTKSFNYTITAYLMQARNGGVNYENDRIN